MGALPTKGVGKGRPAGENARHEHDQDDRPPEGGERLLLDETADDFNEKGRVLLSLPPRRPA